MKRQYIQPQVFISTVKIERHLCAASPVEVKGYRYARWGSDYAVENYGNPDWVNEKQVSQQVNFFEAVQMGGDNAGTLDSRSNEASWED